MIKKTEKHPGKIKQEVRRNLELKSFELLPENVLFFIMKADDLGVREEALRKIIN